MDGISLQLERTEGGSVLTNENVIFDTTVLIEGNITYDDLTGNIIISDPGKYLVNWCVATQSNQSTNGTTFVLETSEGDVFESSSPVKTGEVTGTALIIVDTDTVTISLRNGSTSQIYYSSHVPIKATLVVSQQTSIVGPTGPTGPTGPAFSSAYALIYNQFGPVLVIEPETETVVPLPFTGEVRNVTVGTNSLIIEESGIYSVYATIEGQNITSTTGLQLYVDVNGSLTTDAETAIIAEQEAFIMPTINTIIELNEGDVVELVAYSVEGLTFSFEPAVNARLVLIKIADL